MPGEGRIGRPQTFSAFAVAQSASRKAPRGIAGSVKPRGGEALRLRRRGWGRRHRRIVSRDHAPLARIEVGGYIAHPRIDPLAVGKGDQLALEIAGIDSGEARSEAAVTLAAQAVTGEAGIGRAGSAAAQGDEFTARREALDGYGLDGRAAHQGANPGGDRRELPSRHLGWGTGPSPRRFLRGARSARRVGNRLHRAAAILLPLALTANGCKPPPDAERVAPLASADRGKAAIERVGCAACHTIDGVAWPQGKTAPVLKDLGRRALIAGRLPNRPDVLAAFVRNAPALVPGTTMPAMPLSQREALDVAAYLSAGGR
jgi:mono/diheme cytochrome c family protein